MVSGWFLGFNVVVNVKGSVYIGGVFDVVMLIGGRFFLGIIGCVKNLVLYLV